VSDRPARQVTIVLEGLRVPCRIGVTDDERREAQVLLVDLRLTPLAPPTYEADDLAETADYAALADLVAATAAEREYRLIERLATVVADRVWALAAPAEVTVVVRKPAPPMDVDVASAAAEVTLRR
jgi:dihydroneopterin aldolase